MINYFSDNRITIGGTVDTYLMSTSLVYDGLDMGIVSTDYSGDDMSTDLVSVSSSFIGVRLIIDGNHHVSS